MILYRILLAINGLTALIFGFFFLEGIRDGTVSAFNITLWLGVLGALVAILAGGMILQRRGRRGLAILVLLILAGPACLAGLFFLFLATLPSSAWR